MPDACALAVTTEAMARIVRHARAEAPYECCGLLLGEAGAVETVIPARNVARSRSRYRVHPKDHFDAIRAARARGLTVVGAYHSHPESPARPSESDLAEATCPDYVYAIVSLAGDPDVPATAAGLRAFRLTPGGARQLWLMLT